VSGTKLSRPKAPGVSLLASLLGARRRAARARARPEQHRLPLAVTPALMDHAGLGHRAGGERGAGRWRLGASLGCFRRRSRNRDRDHCHHPSQQNFRKVLHRETPLLMPRQASFARRPNRHNGETPKRTTRHNACATPPHWRIHRAHHERLYIERPSFQSARRLCIALRPTRGHALRLAGD